MGGKNYLKKDDLVVAVSGSASGTNRTGKIFTVKKGRAIVEGFNFVTKTVRKSQDLPDGDIIKKEAPISVSNLQLYCPDCKRGVRITRFKNDKGQSARKCRKCGHEF